MIATFDTLEYSKGAEAVGFTREQAEYQAREIGKMLAERIATKEDLHVLEISLRKEMHHMEMSLKKDMLKLKNDIVIKLGGLMVIATGAIITVLGFIMKI